MSETFTPPPQHGATDSPPSFLVRVFLMPFSPALWRSAPATSAWKIVGALALLSILVGLGLGLSRSYGFKDWMIEQTDLFDEQFDPIVYEDGRLRVEGDRIIHFSENDMTILVDPAETVPMEEFTSSQYVILREREMIQKQQLRPAQTVPLTELEPIIGAGPIIVDSEHLSAWVERWGGTIQFLTVALVVTVGLIVNLITCLVYSAIAGAIILPVRGRAWGLGYGACFKVALAASAATLVMHLALNLLGTGVPGCAGLFIWVPVIAALGIFALWRPAAPDPVPAGA